MLDFGRVMWSFYSPRGKHLCVIWWHGYQQPVGIPMGTTCAQLIVDLFYIVVRGFMFYIHKS